MSKNNENLLEDTEFLAKVLVGIGELSDISGVPQRQIRYWESKGIIAAVPGDSKNRRYNYLDVKKVLLVKEMLDEGFTLDAAAEKIEKRVERINQVFQKVKKSLSD